MMRNGDTRIKDERWILVRETMTKKRKDKEKKRTKTKTQTKTQKNTQINTQTKTIDKKEKKQPAGQGVSLVAYKGRPLWPHPQCGAAPGSKPIRWKFATFEK